MPSPRRTNARIGRPAALRAAALWGLAALGAAAWGAAGCAESQDVPVAPTPPASPGGPGTGGTPAEPEAGPFSLDAGYGRVVLPGSAVTLAASTRGGGDFLAAWRQVAPAPGDGPEAAIEPADKPETVVTLPADPTETVLFRFELTAETAAGERATDTVWIEAFVPDQDPSDLTALADFSGKPGWACDQDPPGAAEVTMVELSDTIQFTSNGVPPHAIGTYPNQGNPNRVFASLDVRTVPKNPAKTDTATEMAEFGITLSGIKLDRDTAESYQNARMRPWNYEALTPGIARRQSEDAPFDWLGSDCNNAHVQPGGHYHYHGPPRAYLRELTGGGQTADMVLGGYAADGFPFYLIHGYADPTDPESGLVPVEASWELRSGTRTGGPGGAFDGTFREDWEFVPGSGDLDRCGGRFGVTPEFPDGTYHYFLTTDYPYIPRCVFGAPDPSFRRRDPAPPPTHP